MVDVVDGEIVEETSDVAVKPSGEDATVLLSLEQLIKNHIASIDKLKDELKKKKQTLEDSFVSDAVYQEHMRLAKEAVKVKSATKSQILKQPQNMQLSQNIRQMSVELKDKQFALSDYLLVQRRRMS